MRRTTSTTIRSKSGSETDHAVSEFAADILPLMIAAGWAPGRHVELPWLTGQDAAHPAFRALSTLAGLHIGECGAGIECARSDMLFVRIEDSWAEIEQWESWLGTRLIGIGYLHHHHGAFYIDTKGRGFNFDLTGDFGLMFLGDTLSDSMRTELLGFRGRPMLAPGKECVEVWGQRFIRGDPAIYQWDQR